MQSFISFAAIVKGKNTNFRVTADNLILASDLVMVLTGKNCNDSNECLRDLCPSLFNKDNFIMRSRSRYVNFKHANELVMVLPGKVAKETRGQFAEIIRSYIAGDDTLLSAVEENSASSSTLAELARVSISEEERGCGIKRKKKEMEREDMLFEVEMQEKRLNNMERLSKIQELRLKNMEGFSNLMTNINPSWKNDARLMLQVEDSIKNAVLSSTTTSGGSQLAIIHKEDGPIRTITTNSSFSSSISVSQVAQELGLRLNHAESIAIGKKVAKAYYEKHGAKPSKHRQWVDGAEREVNSYTEREREIIEEAIKEHK